MHRIVNTDGFKQKTILISKTKPGTPTNFKRKVSANTDGELREFRPNLDGKTSLTAGHKSSLPPSLAKQETFGNDIVTRSAQPEEENTSCLYCGKSSTTSKKSSTATISRKNVISTFAAYAEMVSKTFSCLVCMGIYCSEHCKVINSCKHETCAQCTFLCKSCTKLCCLACRTHCNVCAVTVCPSCVVYCEDCNQAACLECDKELHIISKSGS